MTKPRIQPPTDPLLRRRYESRMWASHVTKEAIALRRKLLKLARDKQSK